MPLEKQSRRCRPLMAIILASLWLSHPVSADTPDAPDSKQEPHATQPADPWPHIKIDRQNKRIDLDAVVVLREADWLELLACSPRTKEHESILAVHARPSHVHLALLTLGLQPGTTMRWRTDSDKVVPASGPPVAVTLLYEQDGQAVEIPANEWIVNQQTKKTLPDNRWLFTGSMFQTLSPEQGEVYMADLNGTVLSLVNFGDDVLARDTNMTNDNDNATWTTRTRFIPPVGTKVIIRLTAVDVNNAEEQKDNK